MSRTIWLAGAAVLAAWARPMMAAEPRDPSLPVVQVAATDGEVVLDGRMDEAVWRGVPVLGPFVNLRGDGYPQGQTEARITRTAKDLILFLRCHEPEMAKIKAVATGGMATFGDDHIEVFVQGAEGEDVCLQFAANSKGVRMQLRKNDDHWGGVWEAASGTFEGGWTLEVALPFATLGRDPANLDTLRVNLCRDRPHAMELSAWSSPRGGQFARLSRFGTIRFVEWLPLQGSVRPPPLGGAAAPVIELTCEPFAARDVANPLQHRPEYTATLQTFSDAAPVATVEQKATFDLGMQRTLKLPFTPPPGRKPSVSLTLRDASGDIVLATTDFPIEVADPRREWRRQIDGALQELQTGRVPEQFRTSLEAWRREAAACTDQTDKERLRALAQTLRSVRLAATLPDGDTAAATTFVLPVFTKTAYDLIPERCGQPLACSVFRGETESMTLHVFALRDLTNVTVDVGDLVAGAETLAATNIDARLVVNWWQSSADGFVSDTPILVPELLVKDDSIVTPDMARQRNVLNFDPRVGPEDPPLLRPFAIPAFHNRQVCLTLRTPATQPAGVYTGRVVVSAAGQPVASAACAVTVLPVAMEPTRGQFSAYNYNRLDVSLKEGDPRPDNRRVSHGYYERLLACVREYGFTALMVFENAPAQWDGKTWTTDLSSVREALRLRRQHGLVGATDYMGFSWSPLGYGTYDAPIAELAAPAPGSRPDGFLAVCRGIKELAEEFGFTGVYVYALDEPTYRNEMPEEIAICRLIQRSGLQAASAIMLKGALEARDVLARPILSNEETVVGERKPVGGLTNAVHYTHPVEDYVRERFLIGAMTWYGGFDGCCPFTLDNMWDDFTPFGGSCRSMGYIYQGSNAPIPTIQLVGYREGVDDFTCLEMLERRVAACRGRKLDAAAAQALAAAETLVRSAPAKFRISHMDASAKLTTTDFNEFRAELQRLIVALDAAAGGVK